MPLSFSTFTWGDQFQIPGKVLWILQAADGEDLMILACTIFD